MEKEQMEVIGGDEDKNKLEEPKQVTEYQNEVTGMEVEEDVCQDGALYNVIASNDQQGQEEGAENQQNHPQKKKKAVGETGQKDGPEWNGNVKEKGESVGLRRSGRRKNDVSKEEHTQVKGWVKRRGSGSKQHVNKKQHQPCEQLEERFKEQDHRRKPSVVWLGRRVPTLKEADDEVTELEDDISEEEDAEVDEHVEQLQKNNEKGETNVEHKRPEENQQLDIIEKQILEKEQLMSVPDDNKLPCERYERLGMGLELVVAEKLRLVARSGTQEDGFLKEWNGKQKQVEGESMKQNGSRLQQNDLCAEQVDLQNKSKEETEDKLHTQGTLLEGSVEQGQLQKQEVKMAGEQDSVTIQCEAQMMVAIEEKQHDDTVEEQIWTEEQSNEDNTKELQTHERQNSGDTKQEVPEKQVDMVSWPLQDESNVMTIQYEAQARAEDTKKTEAEPQEQHDDLTEEHIDTKELSKELHNDVIEESIYSQEQCVERINEKPRSCGQYPLENGEAESAEEQPQQEEQQTEVTQKGIAHVLDTEIQQDLVINQDDTEVHRGCVIQDATQEECCAARNENLATSGSTIEGSRSFPYYSLGVENGCLPDRKQQEEQQTEVTQKGIAHALDTEMQQDLVMNHDETEVHRACIIQDATQEDNAARNENLTVSVSTIEGSRSFLCNSLGVEKVCVPDHKQQEEQQTEVTQKGIAHALDTEMQQYLVMNQEETEVRRTCVIQDATQEEDDAARNENLAASGSTIEGSRSFSCNSSGVEKACLPDHKQQEEQQTEVSQKEIAHVLDTEMKLDLVMNQDETEVGRACVIQDATQEEDDAARNENLAASGSTIEGSRSFSCNSLGVEKACLPDHKQQEEQQTEVSQKEIAHVLDTEMKLDLVTNQDETEVGRACVIQDATQEEDDAARNENLAVSGSTIEGSRSFSCKSLGVEKECLPDHKHQAEQRRPLRQGLRSSCKKDDATPNTKNQLEQVTPVRRSLRHHKTISEAAVITEGPDHSKEQLKHSGRTRSSKRKPIVAQAEPVSKSQKTRRKI